MRHFTPLLAAAASMLITAPASADLGDQLAKLLPDDGAAGDQFTRSVAISGTTAIVGAHYDDDNGSSSGSAYLFDIVTGLQTAKILPDDGASTDFFGYSVAISGTTAIIGARGDNDNGNNSGSAYLFDISNPANPTQIAKLHPDDADSSDFFGHAVAISGRFALVGAIYDNENGLAGSAYLFDISDPANPVQIAKIFPSDSDPVHSFGNAVGISGTTVIVADYVDEVNGDQAGAVYVFDISDPANPVQLAKLLARDGAEDDQLGFSIGISGAIAIAGAPWDDDNGYRAGSAYLFDTTTGQQVGKILASDGAAEYVFGVSVAISGTTAIVGASGNDDNGDQAGSAYLFDTSDPSNPTQIAKLLPHDGAEDDWFGRNVAISGTIAIVGGYLDDDNGEDSGSAYLFVAGALAGTPAALTSCAITFGTTDNPPCDVANLVDDDDVDQILRSQFGFTVFERNLTEIVINGNGADATTMMSIHTHDGSDTANNIVAKLKARNYATNSIDDLAQYSVTFPNDDPSPSNDTSHTTPVGSADYVDANGDVEVRLRYVAPATFTPLGFTVGLDQVEVMVQ